MQEATSPDNICFGMTFPEAECLKSMEHFTTKSLNLPLKNKNPPKYKLNLPRILQINFMNFIPHI